MEIYRREESSLYQEKEKWIYTKEHIYKKQQKNNNRHTQ